jgi:small acid-soluble spore protein K (minor)
LFHVGSSFLAESAFLKKPLFSYTTLTSSKDANDLYCLEGIEMRNKAKGFPNQVNHKFEGEPGSTDAYASKRPNGETNTRPQERMRASGKR